MYLATLDCATSNPSLSSSPWMRGAPHSGFSMLICRIRNKFSASSRVRDLNRSETNIPSACRIVNIALNDVMILSHDANLGRMEFSEGTGGRISLTNSDRLVFIQLYRWF